MCVTDYILRWFTRLQMVTHPSTNLAALGQESQPIDHMSDALTTTLPSHFIIFIPLCIIKVHIGMCFIVHCNVVDVALVMLK